MLARPKRRERIKLLLALCTLLGCAMLTAATAITTIGASSVHFAGDRNSFHLAVAVGEGNNWTPSAADWTETALSTESGGAPGNANLSLGENVKFVAGEAHTYRIAVRNDSDLLPAKVALTVSDPGTHVTSTGERLELFEQLDITVQSGGKTLGSQQSTGGSRRFNVPTNLKPGEQRMYQVTVGLPAGLEASWSDAAADIRFRFDGESR